MFTKRADMGVMELLSHGAARRAIRALGDRRYSRETDALASRKLVAQAREYLAARDARAAARDRPDPLTGTADRLRERLRAATAAAFPTLGAYYRVYSSRKTLTVGAPAVRVETTTKWVSGRRGHGHVVDGQRIYVAACPAWRTRVEARGLAVLGGLVTTHCESAPELAREGIEVYRASWIVQGRGYQLHSQSGWIAIRPASGEHYHSTVGAESALSQLRRRIRAAIESRRQAALGERLARLEFGEFAGVPVSIDDSLAARNCEPATRSFAERWFPGRDSANVADVLRIAANQQPNSLRYAVAACLKAIRRVRHA